MTKFFNILPKNILLFTLLFFCPQLYAQNSPRIVDYKTLSITLKQESHLDCVSCAPVFEIKISGDGTVNYEGFDGVKIKGKQTYRIPAEDVKKIVEEFYAIDFFSLSPEYRYIHNSDGSSMTVDHVTSRTTTITFKGVWKKVYDFYGAPEKLKKLERRIYELSQAEKFIKDAKPS